MSELTLFKLYAKPQAPSLCQALAKITFLCCLNAKHDCRSGYLNWEHLWIRQLSRSKCLPCDLLLMSTVVPHHILARTNISPTVTDPEWFHLSISLTAPSHLSCLWCSLGGYVPAPLTPQQGTKPPHISLSAPICQIICMRLEKSGLVLCVLVSADGTAQPVHWICDNLRFPEHLRLRLVGLFQGKHVWFLR